ncbi:AAA family ATPase [Membranicola marinus]|uniref:AAA family ATPase n=1 Tax=Membranihabitans marinus TaxID=1227546 RepID=A0A953I054_9BACT|nr:AAA domain-containing protein [Membranihabitans marinus]MBY5959941.1 AAA family ATPase [Membranihabitans marinus]
MKTHVLQILVDSLHRISTMESNDTDKYFLLYDAFALFLSQVIKEYDPSSFESHILPYSLFGSLCIEKKIPEHLRFAGFKILRTHHEASSDSFSPQYNNLYWLTIELAHHFSEKKLPAEITKNQVFPADEFWVERIPRVHYSETKVVLLSKKEKTDLTYTAYWVDYHGRMVTIRPDKLMRIRNQIQALKDADQELYFPITVQLFDVDARQDVLVPAAMVFLPDYLIDITAVSQCFTPFGEVPSNYLLRKIQPFSSSHHLLIGNCVNQLLDELIFRPDMQWEEALPLLFRINELTWATYSDGDTRQHIKTIAAQFKNLKNTIRYEFMENGVQKEYCAVEPSFYSPKYGLQGRLDLLYDHPDPTRPKIIIELKSGKIFRPNSYGLNHPHYIQTLLYDLLIRSAYPDDMDPINFILYSTEESNNLRHAPAIKDWQYEALGVRNQLVVMECRLAQWTKNPATLYDILKEKNEHLVGYADTDRTAFYTSYEEAEPVMRAYFDAFLTFLTREQMTAKLGTFSSDRKGQSQLWASSTVDKDQQYLLLAGLEVEKDQSQESNPIVTFRKTTATNPLANFRTGDVILTYPSERKDSPVQGQVFRCSLVEISAEHVVVRLRARQYRPIFLEGTSWYIEHDHLDSSFRQMNQSLIRLLDMPPGEAKVFLGLNPPKRPEVIDESTECNSMTKTQQHALNEMKAIQDYYLLWGPPGTGKTSVLLRNFVAEKLRNPALKILLVGYTNRAVDEICGAVLGIEHIDQDQVLRIGSRYGTDPEYRHLLMRERNQKLRSRAQLVEMLEKSRVVCGTIASISGQDELFDLIGFDYLVIDEASQILEPALISLLSLGIPYILIGDHKQLPAVVNQSLDETYTDVACLHEIGLYYLSNSYFERLFKLAQKNEWQWAYGILTHQGRMHQDLMTYPNLYFYENILEILPFPGGKQTTALEPVREVENRLERVLISHRNLFIPTKSQNFINHKINPEEADRIVTIIRTLRSIRPDLPASEIGVITPYRAQIATIRHAMAEAGLSDNAITVDTVERYQGGAKDVIIISYCINSLSQIHLLKESMTPEGVDRKLNVAMTRAREQIVFLANEELMHEHPLYEALLYQYVRHEVIS